MEFEQAKKRAEELKPLLQYYTKKYFDDEQVVSDYEYDMLMRELKQIEKEYPELITSDSPTQRVGVGSIKKGFEKVTHEVPLQSLQDVFTFEEIEDFDEKMKKAGVNITKFKLPINSLNFFIFTPLTSICFFSAIIIFIFPLLSDLS